MFVNFLKKYWLEIIVFGAITAVLVVCCAPLPTWINTDSDGIHYVYSAHYLYPSHKQGAPLFTLLGHLFLYLPFGSEFWRVALISVLAGIIGSVLIYLIIKEKVRSKWYGVVGALIYGGSALAISQNTIVEAYPIVVTSCLAVYYFAIRKKWLTASIFTGIALALHPTALIVLIPMIIGFKELRKWKRLAVILPFFLFYLYVPITNRPPYMWQESNHEGGVFGYVKDAILTVKLLVGGLAIWDLPKRILDTGGLILLNFTIGIVPLVVAFVNREKGKRWYKNLLLWIILVPVIFFVSNLAPQTYVYLQPAIAFGAIAIGIGLAKMRKEWLWATLGCAVVMLGFNCNYFDIGRTLDKNLSATEYFTVELDKVPDNQILMPYYGWEWAAIYKYNKDNGRNIIPICIDTLVSPEYQKILTEQGIKFDDNNSDSRVDRQNYLALSVVRLNENVWTTRVTDERTYGCEVLKVYWDAENNKLIDVTPQEFSPIPVMGVGSWSDDTAHWGVPAEDITYVLLKVPTEPPAQWHWKPSNPLDIVTGAIEISDWKFITLSNYNIIFFFVWGGGFIYLYWLANKFWEKRDKKKKARKVNGEV